jgi:hypothetical protein
MLQRQRGVMTACGFATPKGRLTYRNARAGRIGKVKRFSLLFGHRFPVMPKSVPVNLNKEFRQKPIWMLRLVMMSSIFQA